MADNRDAWHASYIYKHTAWAYAQNAHMLSDRFLRLPNELALLIVN
jgi:hypothetical protein